MRVLNSNSWMKSPITQPCATPPLHTSQSSGFLDHSSMSSPNQLACGHQGDMLFFLLLMCYNVTYNGLWMSCPNASCGLPIPCCLCPVCIFCCCPCSIHRHDPPAGRRSPDCRSRRRCTAQGKSRPRCTCKPTRHPATAGRFLNVEKLIFPQETIKEEKASILDASESDRESNTDTSESGESNSPP